MYCTRTGSQCSLGRPGTQSSCSSFLSVGNSGVCQHSQPQELGICESYRGKESKDVWYWIASAELFELSPWRVDILVYWWYCKKVTCQDSSTIGGPVRRAKMGCCKKEKLYFLWFNQLSPGLGLWPQVSSPCLWTCCPGWSQEPKFFPRAVLTLTFCFFRHFWEKPASVCTGLHNSLPGSFYFIHFPL